MAASKIMLAAADVLRAAGCEVVEFPGWRERGRPRTFTPRAVVLHHDGSAVGAAQDPYAYADWLFTVGRPAEGIPAPLSQFWIDYYGRWWIGAAGACNHAGTGRGWGVVPANAGNQYSIGVEMDNTVGEPTLAVQYEALHLGLPALFAANDWNPAEALTAHKEYAAGRKSDPDDIDMDQMRAEVGAFMAAPLRKIPEPPTVEETEMKFFRVVVPGPEEPGGDPNIYGHTDTEFWVSSEVEAASFRIGIEGINAAQRDFRRNRVQANARANQQGNVDLVKIVGPDGGDVGKTFAIINGVYHQPSLVELHGLQSIFRSVVREALQVEWDFIKQRLTPRAA